MSVDDAFVHPLAIVETDAQIGSCVKIWEYAKVRSGAIIGENVTIGMGVYIGPGVVVGDNCKIQNYAQIFEPASLGAGVFVGPGAILTNDKHPSAVNPDGTKKTSAQWDRRGVVVEDFVSIGAGAVCVAPVRISSGAVVGAGAVVVSDVPPSSLVTGVPARSKN